jgi:hypothetical protein
MSTRGVNYKTPNEQREFYASLVLELAFDLLGHYRVLP